MSRDLKDWKSEAGSGYSERVAAFVDILKRDPRITVKEDGGELRLIPKDGVSPHGEDVRSIPGRFTVTNPLLSHIRVEGLHAPEPSTGRKTLRMFFVMKDGSDAPEWITGDSTAYPGRIIADQHVDEFHLRVLDSNALQPIPPSEKPSGVPGSLPWGTVNERGISTGMGDVLLRYAKFGKNYEKRKEGSGMDNYVIDPRFQTKASPASNPASPS